MQDLNFEFLSWFLCILCNVVVGCLIILQRKFPSKFNIKTFSVLFFGNLILITIFSYFLMISSKDTGVLIFEIIEIAVLQVSLIIFTKVIWRRESNLYLLMFSCFIFGIFRLSGMYYLYNIILPEPIFSEIAFITNLFYHFSYIICISLFAICILSIICKIFFKKFAFHSTLSLIWASMFIFGLTPLIDLLLQSFGITPIFVIQIYSFIGFNMSSYGSYGTVVLYAFIGIVILYGGILMGKKYGFKFISEGNPASSQRLLRYIGVGLIAIIVSGVWYYFTVLLDFSMGIIGEITILFKFEILDIVLVHPFWLLMIIYGIMLLVPFYCAFIIFISIKKRRNLWEHPNSFNTMPILNLSVLIFAGFILCYNGLIYPFAQYYFVYLHRSFILFVIYFYLIAFLLLLTLYFLTYQKKPWLDLSFSLKSFLLYIPFILGYFAANQILPSIEIFLGILSCAALQIYAIYLRNIKIHSLDMRELNWFMIFIWGVLSSCFAGLLSITCLVCILVNLGLFYIITFNLKQANNKLILYGLISAIMIVMGGTSSTFLGTIFAMGIPNSVVFGVAIFCFIGTVLVIYLQK